MHCLHQLRSPPVPAHRKDVSSQKLWLGLTRCDGISRNVTAWASRDDKPTGGVGVTERSATPDLPNGFSTLPSSAMRLRIPQYIEQNICRLYYFNDQQREVFQMLVNSMKTCRAAVATLAVSNILLTFTESAESSEHGANTAAAVVGIVSGSALTIGDVAYWADSLLVAGLISYSIGPFERVLVSRSNQMARAFQGVNRMALIFQQLSIGSIAVSTVTALEAAAKYPPLVVGASGVFFFVALIRSAAMWWTLARHTTNNEEVTRTLTELREGGGQMSLLDRWAVFLSFGYLLQYEEASKPVAVTGTGAVALDSPPSAPEEAHEPATCYEFSLQEERILRGITEASNTAGLALALQAFMTFLLTVADVGVDEVPSAISNGINCVNKFIMAAILFRASSSVDRALHTCGTNDVEHLMEGLGRKGLTGLFDSLSVLSWGVTIATLAGLALPFVEENALARAVGDGMSHRAAEALVEVLEWARLVLRAI